jgi:hypothetical protein
LIIFRRHKSSLSLIIVIEESWSQTTYASS